MNGSPLIPLFPGKRRNWGYLLRKYIRQILNDPKTRGVFYFLCINLTFTFVEAAYGILSNSLGLTSDAVHMLFDSSALVFGLVASVISKWESTDVYTFGYGRVETLAGFTNGVALVLAALSIIWEAVERLMDPVELKKDILWVSVAGFGVNMIGIFCFDHSVMHGGHSCSHDHHGHGHEHQSHSNENSSHSHSHGCSHSHAAAPLQTIHEHSSSDSVACSHHHHHSHSHQQQQQQQLPGSHYSSSSNVNGSISDVNQNNGGHSFQSQHRGNIPHIHEHYQEHHGRFASSDESSSNETASMMTSIDSVYQANDGFSHNQFLHGHRASTGSIQPRSPTDRQSLLRQSMDYSVPIHHKSVTVSNVPHIHDHLDRSGSKNPSQGQRSHGHSHGAKDVLMHGMFLHVLADTLGSVGVIISSLLIQWFGWNWSDPLCSIFISVLILLSTWPLVKQSGLTLLQRVPLGKENSIEHVRERIHRIHGVYSVSKVHYWEMNGDRAYASLKVFVRKGTDSTYITRETDIICKEELGVRDVTIQVDAIE